MKIRFFLFAVLLITRMELYACVSCNKNLQQGIYDNAFFIVLATLLSIVVLISILILSLNYLVKNYYNKYGRGFSNPAPLTTSAVVLGVGLGGFIDGILFHQILQWHEMLSNKLSPTTVLTKSINMFWDGIFHFSCLAIVFIGVVMLWKLINRRRIDNSKSIFVGGLLLGWGLFNIVEGIIDHQIMQLHNVRENAVEHNVTNLGFLIFSLLIMFIGFWSITKVLGKYKGNSQSSIS